MRTRPVILLLLLAIAITASAQQPAPSPSPSPSAAPPPPANLTEILERTLTGMEKQFVPAAEAMPDDKFDFKPTQGEFKESRTFAQEIKHVAAANTVFTAMLLGTDSSVKSFDEMRDGPANLKTKAEIVQFLKDSFANAHKAVATVNEKNVTEILTFPFAKDSKMTRFSAANIMTWHSFDHYGQMVVYLRMNGIVPPASRPKS